jgi:hypothetical protein
VFPRHWLSVNCVLYCAFQHNIQVACILVVGTRYAVMVDARVKCFACVALLIRVGNLSVICNVPGLVGCMSVRFLCAGWQLMNLLCHAISNMISS